MAAVYEDNFGYYDLEADPDEAAFFAFVKSQSKPRKCLRCSERRDAIIGRAALCAGRRPRLEARRLGEGHPSAEAARLTCGEVNQGRENHRKAPRIMVSSGT